ncbi:hypothetical protein TTHERM_01149260 (macronuclear) [Tetrahymena thermophila SB210]|uniref:Transmembrane protein n=1 Tax=Tetrahymena thermophila (strain SB210) TaxID=312017 RepID=Q23ZB6_TETTS|nr:hypothetical protein TTHERM_01149260 [Tetrahymena thermophila SB210]EAS01855.2 hypothetical protein TTHERM_01149260 [Tetrahymena thermophila SB210]|eukprot:XP_001022100.2 hypothetical protein TTHERM_01149260 [Tetrahymena thermophila SB210]
MQTLIQICLLYIPLSIVFLKKILKKIECYHYYINKLSVINRKQKQECNYYLIKIIQINQLLKELIKKPDCFNTFILKNISNKIKIIQQRQIYLKMEYFFDELDIETQKNLIKFLNIKEDVSLIDQAVIFNIERKYEYTWAQKLFQSTIDPSHFILNFPSTGKKYIFLNKNMKYTKKIFLNEQIIYDDRLFSVIYCFNLIHIEYSGGAKHFIKALSLNQDLKDLKNMKWRQSGTNWGKATLYSRYYQHCEANCLGSCSKCVYFLQEEELKNSFIPYKIEQNPKIIFENTLFEIAKRFNDYL